MTEAVHDASPAALVAVFGLDDAGKPHASRFSGQEAELASKAAALMGFTVVPLASPEHDELAEQLPHGRIFASGKGFVPFAKRPLYDRLAAMAGLPAIEPMVGRARPAGDGRRAAKADKPEAGRPKHAKGKADEPQAETNTPSDWAGIGLHSLVLVTMGGSYAPWHEAVVIADKGDDLFQLRWRDWPKERPFLRRRNQLGLVPLGEQPDE